jgi:hypothetical protein
METLTQEETVAIVELAENNTLHLPKALVHGLHIAPSSGVFQLLGPRPVRPCLWQRGNVVAELGVVYAHCSG